MFLDLFQVVRGISEELRLSGVMIDAVANTSSGGYYRRGGAIDANQTFFDNPLVVAVVQSLGRTTTRPSSGPMTTPAYGKCCSHLPAGLSFSQETRRRRCRNGIARWADSKPNPDPTTTDCGRACDN